MTDDRYPFSLAIRTGYNWAVEHDIEHNHDSLFDWGGSHYFPENLKLRSACAVGFGWLGALLLCGIEEQSLFTEVKTQSNDNVLSSYIINPDGGYECVDPNCDSAFESMENMIIHLNDYHKWDIDAILAWVCEHEPVETTVEVPPRALEAGVPVSTETLTTVLS